ncbi:toll/interleukin-1 receptor domain-containing protein, partial [Gemmobacter denitrificans]
AQKAMEAAITAVVAEAQRLGVSPKGDQLSTKDSTMTAGPDPAKPVSYYVSYAWNDNEDPAAGNIEGVVDDLCAKAKKRGIDIHRDKDNITLGGRISEYMAQLARGDRIIVILSDRYLKSRACMLELYEIWIQARAEDATFLEKVRVFTHPDTKIFTPVDRAKVAKHWADLYEEEKPLLDHMGVADRVGHLALKKFAAHVGDILSLVADTLHPRQLDDLLKYSFD